MKPEYHEKTTDLSQVTDRLYHIMLYRVYLAMSEIVLETFHNNRYIDYPHFIITAETFMRIVFFRTSVKIYILMWILPLTPNVLFTI